jgi:hypothetical protein
MTGATVNGVFTLFFAVTPAVTCCTAYPYVFTFDTQTQLFGGNLGIAGGVLNYVVKGLANAPIAVAGPALTPSVTESASPTAAATASLSFGASNNPTAAATNTGTSTSNVTPTPVATARFVSSRIGLERFHSPLICSPGTEVFSGDALIVRIGNRVSSLTSGLAVAVYVDG